MFRTTLAVFVAVCLAACGKPPATKPTASKTTSAVKSSAGPLKSSKASATKTMTSPKPIPAAKTAGNTTVNVPDPTKGGTVEVDTWAFANIDLDGSGNGNNGVIIADDSTLVAFFDGSYDTGTYTGVVFADGSGVGFLFDFGDSGALACGETASGTSGCVACDSSGTCSETGPDSTSASN